VFHLLGEDTGANRLLREQRLCCDDPSSIGGFPPSFWKLFSSGRGGPHIQRERLILITSNGLARD
jgi:hypothetical protein